jgi:predicted secreted Zn-dependent protease
LKSRPIQTVELEFTFKAHLSKGSLIEFKGGQTAAAIFSRRLNFFAINGRTSSAPTKLSKNGSNVSSSLSERSSNQLSMGTPLSTWNPNAYEKATLVKKIKISIYGAYPV